MHTFCGKAKFKLFHIFQQYTREKFKAKFLQKLSYELIEKIQNSVNIFNKNLIALSAIFDI